MRVFTLALALAALSSVTQASPELFHIQTDKSSYQLGETLFYRVHGPVASSSDLDLLLLGPQGEVLERHVINGAGLEGKIAISTKALGGEHRLRLARGPEQLHELPLDFYEIQGSPLNLRLSILSERLPVGGRLCASYSLTDARGQPIEGLRPRVLARFGAFHESWEAPATDCEGRGLLRWSLPKEILDSGTLCLGVERGKERAVCSREVQICSGVGEVLAFPEGGAILEGFPQNLGLLIRDLDGRPSLAAGRIYDDRGQCVGCFDSDASGLALIEVPYEKGRRYSLRVDRPAGVDKVFDLPGPTGHSVALSLIASPSGGPQLVRVASKTSGALWLRVFGEDGLLEERSLNLSADPQALRLPDVAKLQLGDVVVGKGDRALARSRVLLGRGRRAVVQVGGGSESWLAGQAASLDLLSLLDKKPGLADLSLVLVRRGFESNSGPADLALRALLEPQLGVLDAASLAIFQRSPGELTGDAAHDLRARQAAVLAMRAAFCLPIEGQALSKKSETIKELEGFRRALPKMTPRPRVSLEKAKASRARDDLLDRMMARAHFQRQARAGRGESGWEFSAAGRPALAAALLGKKNRELPQIEGAKARGFDDRETLAWVGRLLTKKNGQASLRLLLGDVPGPLSLVVQGYCAGEAISQTFDFSVEPPFKVEMSCPTGLCLGDEFSLEPSIITTSKDPVLVELKLPDCLQALSPTIFRKEPRKDSLSAPIRLRVRALAEDAELSVVVVQGGIQARSRYRLSVNPREPEQVIGVSGIGDGEINIPLEAPSDAIPESLVLEAHVLPSSSSISVESVERLLEEPTGCFEQTSSANYPNLELLSFLRENGSDAAIIERAYGMAKRGFERIKSFQHSNGGFSLFPSGLPEPHLTALAVPQLVLTMRHFQGLGAAELGKALGYLSRAQLNTEQCLQLAMALSECDKTEAGLISARELRREDAKVTTGLPKDWAARLAKETKGSAMATALLCNALLKSEDGTELQIRDQAMSQLRESLQQPWSGEEGLMGSLGAVSGVEFQALAAVALWETGEPGAARYCVNELARVQCPLGGWYGTRATALAVRAFTRVRLNEKEEAGRIELRRDGRLLETWAVNPSRARPLVYREAMSTRSAELKLRLPVGQALPWRANLRYRRGASKSSPEAPYRIRTEFGRTYAVGEECGMQLHIEAISKTLPKGQVVALVRLPGGCQQLLEKAEDIAEKANASHVALKNGLLEIYWSKGLDVRSFGLRLMATNSGLFELPPAIIYPYYEEKKEALSAGLQVKVLGGQYRVSDAEAGAVGR